MCAHRRVCVCMDGSAHEHGVGTVPACSGGRREDSGVPQAPRQESRLLWPRAGSTTGWDGG